MEVFAFIQLLASRIRMFDDGSMGFRLHSDYELDKAIPNSCIAHPEDGSGEFLHIPYLQGTHSGSDSSSGLG